MNTIKSILTKFSNDMKQLPFQTLNDLPRDSMRVIGLGGAGCYQIKCNQDFLNKLGSTIAVNTDLGALQQNPAKHKLLVGPNVCKGDGCQGDVQKVNKACQESQEQLSSLFRDCSKLLLMAGLGGGTGSSLLSFMIKAMQPLEVKSRVIVTLPFDFEGLKRQ